ncbi:hypothetical protein ES708_26992 [subsurface metagenome]
MTELIKAAAIPVILVLLIAGSWYFIANGTEGAFVTGWISLTFTSITGYLGGLAAKAVYKGYKALKRGR